MSRQLTAVLLCLLGLGRAQTPSLHTADKPIESPHTAGPHDLEGWTLNWPLFDGSHAGERFPFTLVIARHGHILQKIGGGPFVWRWIFWADGKQVAYEAGPFHFSMACRLVDVTTGRQIENLDCFHALPENAPAWEKALENSR